MTIETNNLVERKPSSTFDAAHDALNRMRRASVRGTGCYLTAAMIESLSRTMLGETWSEPPRASLTQGGKNNG